MVMQQHSVHTELHHAKKIKRSSTPVGELELEIIKELRRGQSTPSADEDDLFGQSVAATLRTFLHSRKPLLR